MIPFYINPDGVDVVKEIDILKFQNGNPELTNFIDSHQIELRLLSISSFESFCYWIIGQQISVHVANILINRFQGLISQISATAVLTMPSSKLKSIGLSTSKITYLQNLAEFFLEEGELSHAELSSTQIREYYLQIKGVGPWTVNMFLIFNLGRMDIIAIKDLVVRKGLQIMYKRQNIPAEAEAIELTKKWGNLGTIGTLLSWELVGD